MKTEQIEMRVHFETQKTFSNECGVHALNNILGEEVFNCDKLNEICRSLSSDFINPHKHIFGGDFDVNILMIALQGQGYECCWSDNRQKQLIFTPQNLRKQEILGFLINKRLEKAALPAILKNILGFSDRHWMAIKKINSKYVLLDSKGEKPEQLGNIAVYLTTQAELGSHIIQVCKKKND